MPIKLAANLISGIPFKNYGHLQLVMGTTEIEVQAPKPEAILGKWEYSISIKQHDTTPNYGDPQRYKAIDLLLPTQRWEGDVWNVLTKIHKQFTDKGTDIDYDINQNSNSYINTLMYMVGIPLSGYLSSVSPSLVTDGFPGASTNVILNGAANFGFNLTLTSGKDLLKLGNGNDTVNAGAGNDTINGGKGNDSLMGGEGSDSLNGDVDNDSLYGGAGSDFIVGGDGNDFIKGDDGNDKIFGGRGKDRIDAGAGNNLIYGGRNTVMNDGEVDTLDYSKQPNWVSYSMDANEIPYAQDGIVEVWNGYGGTDTVAGFESIIGTKGNDFNLHESSDGTK